jgi:hypothetical protein
METVVECFVTDEIVLDKLAFNEWVAGRTAADAARQKEKELAKWLLNAQPPHRIANAFDPKWVMSRKINMQECAEQVGLRSAAVRPSVGLSLCTCCNRPPPPARRARAGLRSRSVSYEHAGLSLKHPCVCPSVSTV